MKPAMVPALERSHVVLEPVSSISEKTKVPGVHWNSTQDVFILDPSVPMPNVLNIEFTTRNVVRVVCGFYNPIGLAAPIGPAAPTVIQFKVFLH